MTYNKRCELHLIQKIGFDIITNEGDEETHKISDMPIGICDNRAKHSIVSKQSDAIGGHIKQIIRLCDEHFESLKEGYDEGRFGQHPTPLTGHVPAKDQICPCCGEKAEKYRSRLRFRKNRV